MEWQSISVKDTENIRSSADVTLKFYDAIWQLQGLDLNTKYLQR